VLSNAIKFSNHRNAVHVRLKDENQAIRFEVEDEGPGIMEEDKPRPFRKFQK
jgi:signal transduction histidine kinase